MSEAEGNTFAAAVLADFEIALMLLDRVPSNTHHGPSGKGERGPCDPDCLKCMVQVYLDNR